MYDLINTINCMSVEGHVCFYNMYMVCIHVPVLYTVLHVPGLTALNIDTLQIVYPVHSTVFLSGLKISI